MRKREIILDFISKLLWCIFIPCVVMINNAFLRALAIFFGISCIITIVELGRYILTDEAPFFRCIQKIIKTSDRREKLLCSAELAIVPVGASVILIVMITMLTRFFVLIGA